MKLRCSRLFKASQAVTVETDPARHLTLQPVSNQLTADLLVDYIYYNTFESAKKMRMDERSI